MCGVLYHAIFPALNVMREAVTLYLRVDEIIVTCPDSYNLLTVKLRRVKKNNSVRTGRAGEWGTEDELRVVKAQNK